MITTVPPHPSSLAPDVYIEHATKMAAGAQMTYRGGPLLSKVELTAVFLGDWSGFVSEADAIASFNQKLVTGSYLDELVEYGVGRGSFSGRNYLPWDASTPPGGTPGGTPQTAGCVTNVLMLPLLIPFYALAGARGRLSVVGSAPTTIDDLEIRTRLRAALASKLLPAWTPNSLYMVYVQPGVSVTMGGDSSCSAFCGYHESDGNGLYYGVIPWPSCAGCTGPLSNFDALTSVTSHELAEACTDPVPGQGWYNDAAGEIGDPCAWSNRTLDGYTVQLEWLNSKSGCG